MLANFSKILSSDFFRSQRFQTILSVISSDCQAVWINIGPDLGPNWFQSYKQKALAANRELRKLFDV